MWALKLIHICSFASAGDLQNAIQHTSHRSHLEVHSSRYHPVHVRQMRQLQSVTYPVGMSLVIFFFRVRIKMLAGFYISHVRPNFLQYSHMPSCSFAKVRASLAPSPSVRALNHWSSSNAPEVPCAALNYSHKCPGLLKRQLKPLRRD